MRCPAVMWATTLNQVSSTHCAHCDNHVVLLKRHGPLAKRRHFSHRQPGHKVLPVFHNTHGHTAVRIAHAHVNNLHVRPHTVSIHVRRLTQLDPWLPVDTTVQPYGGYWRGGSTAAAVDLNDTVLLEQYATAITPLPVRQREGR